MTTRYALADESGLVMHCGPAASFETMTQALCFLLTIPGDDALNLHVVALDGDFPEIPLPPCPPLES